ncbi:MAG: PHP domain-containing protein [Candidatus Micrarchaeota archaeon]
MIDLHTHTTASDGSFQPAELVELARRAGFKAIAITDHDSVAGFLQIKKHPFGLEIIPGIELSIYDYELGYIDLHILGLFIDPKNKNLQEKLIRLNNNRQEQKKATITKLNELGYQITFSEVQKMASGTIGRPHIAKVLLAKYPDKFTSISDIFNKLLDRGKPAFIDRKIGFTLKEAVNLIHSAGGLSFIAHPFHYPYDVKKLLIDFKNLGGNGVETYFDYQKNRPLAKYTTRDIIAMITQLEHFAHEFGLLECGGSDFHGTVKQQTFGLFFAPDEILGMLKAALSDKKFY